MRWFLTCFLLLFAAAFLYNREAVQRAKRNATGAVLGGGVMAGQP